MSVNVTADTQPSLATCRWEFHSQTSATHRFWVYSEIGRFDFSYLKPREGQALPLGGYATAKQPQDGGIASSKGCSGGHAQSWRAGNEEGHCQELWSARARWVLKVPPGTVPDPPGERGRIPPRWGIHKYPSFPFGVQMIWPRTKTYFEMNYEKTSH